jgi:hypothetical protein
MHFVVVFGPPAVGKMTVGHELTKLTGYKLFHNHMTVEPVRDLFPFGSPPFSRLVNEFRHRVIEEAVLADLPGLVFTFVWGLDLPGDAALLTSYAEIVESAGGRVSYVELYADLDERLRRNTTEFRLAEKRSKRDLALSHGVVLELEEGYRMNTGPDLVDLVGPDLVGPVLAGHDYLRVDNTDLPAADVAARVVEAFAL